MKEMIRRPARSIIFSTFSALLAGVSPAGAKPASVARLIPGLSPVVFVTSDPARFAESLRGYLLPGGEERSVTTL